MSGLAGRIHHVRSGTLAGQASTMDLHDACENGNKYLIKKKLENGDWKVTNRDETGRTGLHAACFGAQLDVVKLLFGYKVPMDVGDGGRKKKKRKRLEGPQTRLGQRNP